MIGDRKFEEIVRAHYEAVWHVQAREVTIAGARLSELPSSFCVLEFPPTETRRMWTYGTCGMSQLGDASPIELHLFSPAQSREPVEILMAIAHFHRTGSKLDLGHTVNFGKPWIDASTCEYGLISLPYLDGPELENLPIRDLAVVKFYWLIPITRSEREFKKLHGLEALEDAMDNADFNYLDLHRDSVI